MRHRLLSIKGRRVRLDDKLGGLLERAGVQTMHDVGDGGVVASCLPIFGF
jgi:hypothetical protein